MELPPVQGDRIRDSRESRIQRDGRSVFRGDKTPVVPFDSPGFGLARHIVLSPGRHREQLLLQVVRTTLLVPDGCFVSAEYRHRFGGGDDRPGEIGAQSVTLEIQDLIGLQNHRVALSNRQSRYGASARIGALGTTVTSVSADVATIETEPRNAPYLSDGISSFTTMYSVPNVLLGRSRDASLENTSTFSNGLN